MSNYAGYTKKDGVLIVTYRDGERLPHSYFREAHGIPQCDQRVSYKICTGLEDVDTGEPIIFGVVAALDIAGEEIASAETDLEGFAFFDDEDKPYSLLIS